MMLEPVSKLDKVLPVVDYFSGQVRCQPDGGLSSRLSSWLYIIPDVIISQNQNIQSTHNESKSL